MADPERLSSSSGSETDSEPIDSSDDQDMLAKEFEGKHILKTIGIFDAIRFIARDAMYGYVFWSVFMGLPPMIWFYPLNELEISGYEAFAALYLTPLLCLIPGVLTFIQNRWILSLLRLLTVASLWSFQAETTLARLVILASGAGLAMLAMAGSLWNSSRAVRHRSYWGLIVGLHGFLASRVWGATFVPTWWDLQSNSIIMAFGVIAVLGYCTEEDTKDDVLPLDQPRVKGRGSWVTCGLGLGSLLHLTHWLFGEASLLARWTVKAYPDTGPQPLVWGSMVLLCLLLGSLGSPPPLPPGLNVLMATCCFFTLYLSPNPYLAFAAGCALAYLTMCLWPVVIDGATRCHPGLCLSLAALVYIVQILFWVWTVAYNFVPYGEYTREHTDWLIVFTMGGIGLMVASSPKDTDSHTVQPPREKSSVPSYKQYGAAMVFVFLVGQAGMARRTMDYNPGAYQTAMPEHTFSAAIWTFHFGYDNTGWPSMERGAQLLNDTGADVITLLESDASKPFLGNNDLGQWMGERLQMYVDFGPATKDHTWGNLILSKYPIVKSVHHLLPSPHGELAPAVTATINIKGRLVDFVVTHMGNDRDKIDRKLQAAALAKELRDSPRSAVFLGYVTSQPGSPNYRHLLDQGGVKDIDPTDKGRWCEYIMYKKLIRQGYARVTHGGLSDTEVQMATFRLPEDPDNYIDNSLTTTDPDSQAIDEGIRFNPTFGDHHRGHGRFLGHGFHMDTPKYFYNNRD